MNNIRERVLEEITTSFMKIDQNKIDELVKCVLDAERIFLYGEMREDIPMQGFCMRLNHLGLTAYRVGDLCTPAMKYKDLLIISCASGQSEIGEIYIKSAGQAGAKVILLEDSSANSGQEPDTVITIPVPDNIGENVSIQPYGALYEQVLWLILDYAELLLQDFVGGDEMQRVNRHANIL